MSRKERTFTHWPIVKDFPALKTALVAAERAGILLTNAFYQKEYMRGVKPDKSDYTPFDQQSEDTVRQVILHDEPESLIMGEEGSPEEDLQGNGWVIDGIDGTTNFSRGIPVTNVTLAKVVEGRVTVGVVNDFLHRQMYYAVEGQGAFRNGKKLSVSNREFGESLISFAPLLNVRKGKGSSEKEEVDAVWKSMREITEASGRFHREFQSGALELAYVAAGMTEEYVSSWTSPWDLSAGVLLVREAGGKATNVLGEEWQPGYWGVIAGNVTVHAEIFEIIHRNFLAARQRE